jgi:hypothetical protein
MDFKFPWALIASLSAITVVAAVATARVSVHRTLRGDLVSAVRDE